MRPTSEHLLRAWSHLGTRSPASPSAAHAGRMAIHPLRRRVKLQTHGKVKQLLAGTRETKLTGKFPQLSRHLSVMLVSGRAAPGCGYSIEDWSARVPNTAFGC